jgi:hypothetical protein
MTSATFAGAFLSFSGALLLKVFNMSTSFFAGMMVQCATDTYPLIGPVLGRSTNATMSAGWPIDRSPRRERCNRSLS